MIEKLKCVTPAVLTPLTKDGSFDEQGMRKLIKHLMDRGMNSLFVLGYSGEVRAFNKEERRRIIEVTRDAAGKDAFIIAGALGDSTQLIQEHCEEAFKGGADMTLITPTDFFFLTDEELEDLFVRLNNTVKLPFMIYNCPENHHYVKPEMMARLAKKEKIIALKQSTTTHKIQDMLQALDPKDEFIMLSGDEFAYFPAMVLGVQGFIMGGPGNISPKMCNEILANYRADKLELAREQYMKMISFYHDLYYSLPYPMAIPQIKAVMEIAGVCERWMRHPVKSVTDSDMHVIENMLKRHNIQF